MDARDILMRTLYSKLVVNSFKPHYFVLDYVDGFCTVSCPNENHTVLFKVSVKSEIESVPLILPVHEIIKETFSYKSLGEFNPVDVDHCNNVNNFYEDMTNEAGYVECSYDELYKICKIFPDGAVSINNCGQYSVVSIRLLKSVFLERPDYGEVFLKINHDGPVFVMYDWYCFRVYAAIAPRVTSQWDANVIWRL